MSDDVQIVSWSVGVIRDTALERKRKDERMRARNGEPFTATTDCPKCGTIAVHYLTEPRLEPVGDEPVHQAQRRILRALSMLTFCEYDPPGTTVARVCVNCEHRWGQR